jgi:polyhydroxyalkanoate synthesis regulator protein
MKRQPTLARPPAPRVVTRYAGRRLYDTDTGSYVTVDQLRLLAAETEVLVYEAKTGEDITR